ncbi:helix-turn-helix domain-containing protein [Streptomyces nitrosporeus]|uniref:helix-turn-helix domain-containing protein n=1 Tax=Streptomyces nitrosporeus TaxID=28894 RepID=UPI0039A0F47C
MLTELSVHDESLLRDALVQQARRSGATSAEMAARMGMSTAVFARRYTTAAVYRRLAASQTRPDELDRAAQEAALPAQRGDLPTDPALLLARALNDLVEHAQRGGSGKRTRTRQELAEQARVHPSYLSRVITGKRRPSWGTTYRITLACDGEVHAIRTLWEAAAYSGSTQDTASAHTAPPRPSTLRDLLRGLFLAAGRPPDVEIERRGGGRLKDIQAILDGHTVGWEAVSKFSAALGGDPSTALPLWTLAYSNHTVITENTPDRNSR